VVVGVGNVYLGLCLILLHFFWHLISTIMLICSLSLFTYYWNLTNTAVVRFQFRQSS
jgi:hypothetical protein